MDFSTTIELINNSAATLGLIDSDPVQGKFPNGHPPSMIEPGEREHIVIHDNAGRYGSHGTCIYELHFDAEAAGSEGSTISLDFGDPTGWNDNWIKVQNSSSDIIVDIQPYKPKGHPFYATVYLHSKEKVTFDVQDLPTAGPAPEYTYMMMAISEKSAEKGDGKISTQFGIPDLLGPDSIEEPQEVGELHVEYSNYHIGFKDPTGGYLVDNKPIHETIVIAALINSKVYTPRGTEYGNLTAKQWEYIRGVIWNDDPSCLLFNDDPNNNHSLGKGAEWYIAFKSFDSRCMTKRSHFGDLQFLHAMASKAGEPAQTTKDDCLAWLEVMYKLACGGQGISEHDRLEDAFQGRFFNNTSENPGSRSSLRDLLLATTQKYGAAKVELRALGTCLHLIADSYAHGHTRRAWLNEHDLDPSTTDGDIRFKPGTYGRCGSVITFHTYDGQDDRKHKHYDMLIGNMPKPSELDSFNKILGARDAIEKSSRLINYWHARTPWEQGVEEFLRDDVFKLHDNVTPADTGV